MVAHQLSPCTSPPSPKRHSSSLRSAPVLSWRLTAQRSPERCSSQRIPQLPAPFITARAKTPPPPSAGRAPYLAHLYHLGQLIVVRLSSTPPPPPREPHARSGPFSTNILSRVGPIPPSLPLTLQHAPLFSRPRHHMHSSQKGGRGWGGAGRPGMGRIWTHLVSWVDRATLLTLLAICSRL